LSSIVVHHHPSPSIAICRSHCPSPSVTLSSITISIHCRFSQLSFVTIAIHRSFVNVTELNRPSQFHPTSVNICLSDFIHLVLSAWFRRSGFVYPRTCIHQRLFVAIHPHQRAVFFKLYVRILQDGIFVFKIQYIDLHTLILIHTSTYFILICISLLFLN
jgi:hypothetical protein